MDSSTLEERRGIDVLLLSFCRIIISAICSYVPFPPSGTKRDLGTKGVRCRKTGKQAGRASTFFGFFLFLPSFVNKHDHYERRRTRTGLHEAVYKQTTTYSPSTRPISSVSPTYSSIFIFSSPPSPSPSSTFVPLFPSSFLLLLSSNHSLISSLTSTASLMSSHFNGCRLNGSVASER